MDATSVSVGGIFADTTSGNTVKGNIATALPGNTTATVPVSVYYAGELVGTTNLTYTNVAPVATNTKFEYTAVAVGTDGTEPGRTGVKFSKAIDGTEFTASAGDDYKIKDGKLTITGANSFGDTFEAWITDQYGVTMKDTAFYLNGAKLTSKSVTVPAGRNVWEFKNDTQGKAFYMTSNGAALEVTEYAAASVDTAARLNVAVAAATGNGKADTITFTGIDTLTDGITIEEGDTLVIAAGAALKTANTKSITVNGKLTNNGTLDLPETITINTKGNVENNGTVKFSAGAAQALKIATPAEGTTWFTNNGTISADKAGEVLTITVPANTKFVNNKKVDKGQGTINIDGAGTWVNNNGSETVANSVNLNSNNTFENAGVLKTTDLAGFVKLLNGGSIIASGTCTPVITVAPGATATIGTDATIANTVTLKAAEDTSLVVTATNGKTVTATIGAGSIQVGTGTAEPVTKTTEIVALANLTPAASQAQPWEEAVAKVGGSLDADAKAQGTGNIGWLAISNLDADAYYYYVFKSGSSDEELVAIITPDGKTTTMRSHGKTYFACEWNDSTQVSNNGAVKSIEVYASAVDIDDAILAGCTTNTVSNYKASEGTLDSLLTKLGAEKVRTISAS